MLETSRIQLNNTSIDNNLTVIAPTGAYGNHLRTLLLLDPRYSFTYAPSRDNYDIFSGPDWPEYSDYIKNGIPNDVLENIKDEIENLCHEHDFLNFYKVDNFLSKEDFIFREIYNNDRSWHNWIWSEFRWRFHLDSVIKLSHKPDDVRPDGKNIILTSDPYKAYRSYLKFNSNLNFITVEHFLKEIDKHNHLALNAVADNVLVLPCDSLFAETLDHSLYTKIVSWLGYTNMYDQANTIHRMWYQLHKKCEQEIGQFFTNFYKH